VVVPPEEQECLPGVVWPQAAVAQPKRSRTGGIPKPIIDVVEIEIKEADRLLAEYEHPLGPASKRPFGLIGYALRAFGTPVAVCVSASSPNGSVHKDYGLQRYNTVDLARIGRANPAVTLAALRLWRVYLAPLYAERYAKSGWGRHELSAAITYSLPGTPSSASDGHGIYRRDGWKCIRRRKLSQPGSNSWSKRSAAADRADGIAGLWAWFYEPTPEPGQP
jgi:hypothetical protein